MSPSMKSQFEQDGFVVLPSLFPPETMREWKSRIIEKLKGEDWDKNPTGVRVWMIEDLDSYFLEGLTGSQLTDPIKEVLGGPIEFLSVKPVYKNGDTTFGSPWHQDWWYWNGSHKVSVWIALDRATPANGCLKMIPGSHREVLERDPAEEGSGFNKRIDESRLPEGQVVSLEVNAGDAVLFHDLTLHASHPNTDRTDRWSFIATYREAEVPDDSTVWKRALLV